MSTGFQAVWRQGNRGRRGRKKYKILAGDVGATVVACSEGVKRFKEFIYLRVITLGTKLVVDFLTRLCTEFHHPRFSSGARRVPSIADWTPNVGLPEASFDGGRSTGNEG